MYENYTHMFKEAKSKREKKEFDHQWKKVCEDNKVKFVPTHENNQCFFIMDGDKKIGTVAFNKRDPKIHSFCENHYKFEENEKVSKNYNEVFEIGKISIKEEHTGNGHLDKVLLLLTLHSQINNVKQYIAFMNLKLYRALVLNYGIRALKVGEEVVTDLHTSGAVICDVPKTLRKLQETGRFNYPILKKAER